MSLSRLPRAVYCSVRVGRGSVTFGNLKSQKVCVNGILFPFVAFVYSLNKGRKPLYKCKRLAAVTIGNEAAEWVYCALVEAEVGPGNEPSELDEDPRGLVTENTEYVRDGDLKTEERGKEGTSEANVDGGDNGRT